MKRKIVLVVPDDAPPDRLDHYLGAHAPELSRTRAKEIILGGLVTLNGENARPSAPVVPGDVIAADVPELERLRATPEDIPLDVYHEDDDIIVVNKPAGMVVHPAPGSTAGTLVNALLGRGGSLSAVGGDLRPGIVHRLDRDTSGLIVVARNDVAHRALSRDFSERKVKKTYLALVWGVPRNAEGTIDEPIGRRRSDRKRMTVRADGREAVTHYRVAEEFPYAALLSVRTMTGRTHQIRVHLAHLHHPVMGDADYGGDKRSFAEVSPHYRRHARKANAAARRQALHARELVFEHPGTGREMRFTSPLPDDIATLLFLMRNPEDGRGRVMGVDPGDARVGLSVSDEGRLIARPLETIEAASDSGAAAAIAALVREMEVDTIAVGYPIRMDGTLGPRAARARELAVAIEDAAHVRVVLQDERLSSVEAERILRERGERTRGRKGRVDALAASVILQGYLDGCGRDGLSAEGPEDAP